MNAFQSHAPARGLIILIGLMLVPVGAVGLSAQEAAKLAVNPSASEASEASKTAKDGLEELGDKTIPEVLRPWQDWVTWNAKCRDCPTLYNSSEKPVCSWLSAMEISVDGEGGTFTSSVRVFEEAWVALPGSEKQWPMSVKADQHIVPVVRHAGVPSVKLAAGLHQLTGEFQWAVMPQRVAIPKEIGILSLMVEDAQVDVPQWDNDGQVWLKRMQGKPTDKDQMSIQVFRRIEDGIPLWLRTEIELTVSGKSRQEQLGSVLPMGWKIATVDSPIPVAIDDQGTMKAQVRAGKWTVRVNAFRTTHPESIEFSPEATPATATELIGLKTDPTFRVSQLQGVPPIDVTQTTFPAKWRNDPVHLWDTTQPFELIEKMRGMGQQSPGGIQIARRMWLDDDGNSMTYHDKIVGTQQQTWRLDASEGYQLGAVRIDGEAQLITSSPVSGNRGVEIRRRDLKMEAIGRVDRRDTITATGWQTDVDSLKLTFTLPPGWRVLAVLGADQVVGDWLTAWSLLDLFLLLVFTFSVFRLYGFIAGIVALFAFGLGYHELGAPRLLWLFPLIPIALLRVVGETPAKKFLTAGKVVAMGCLLLALIPFVAYQTQAVIYPQLERPGAVYGQRGVFNWLSVPRSARVVQSTDMAIRSGREQEGDLQSDYPFSGSSELMRGKRLKQKKAAINPSNMMYDPKSRIQTGPAQPHWDWNAVRCSWNGPVTKTQSIRPILISLTQHRILTVIRLVLLFLLVAILFGGRVFRFPFSRRTATRVARAAAILLVPFLSLVVLSATPVTAQIPGPEVLDTLRERLIEKNDAYPNAADISSVDLTLEENKIKMKVVVHAALDVAVPLPGRLPAWSPVSVTLDGTPDVLITRQDGYLWVLSPKGVHTFVVNGLLPDSGDWECTFALKPRKMTVHAEGWKVTGIGRDGVPGPQVFLTREKGSSDALAASHRTSLHAVVAVDRYLEIGLITKVRTVVRRLSAGRAVTLELPLLPGESVLSSGRDIKDGKIVVNLSASQGQDEWSSELPGGNEIELTAAETDRWVERWHLDASPIWNVTMKGFRPIYEPDNQALVPVWHPWPGESVTLSLNKPVAVTGDTMTVQKATFKTQLGSRLRDCQLSLEVECSLANDFLIEIAPDVEVSSLTIDQRNVPVQINGTQLVVPARPGKQTVSVHWKNNETLQTRSVSHPVTLPVEASNVTTVMQMPRNRWVLWTSGPLQGPAVRFWTILVTAVLASLVLASLPLSPLGRFEWVLLAIGLTQIHLAPALIVVGWLFLTAWRGKLKDGDVGVWTFNATQLAVVLLTAISLLVLLVVVSKGLLGSPDMFVTGNGSSQTNLRWFQGRVGQSLPAVSVISVSVWYYRLLMLLWALWLASSLLRWLTWGWQQFSEGGFWKRSTVVAVEVVPSDEEQ